MPASAEKTSPASTTGKQRYRVVVESFSMSETLAHRRENRSVDQKTGKDRLFSIFTNKLKKLKETLHKHCGLQPDFFQMKNSEPAITKFGKSLAILHLRREKNF